MLNGSDLHYEQKIFFAAWPREWLSVDLVEVQVNIDAWICWYVSVCNASTDCRQLLLNQTRNVSHLSFFRTPLQNTKSVTNLYTQ